MKKALRALLLSFLLLFTFTGASFAAEENSVEAKNCIDMEAYYDEVKNSSQALTGESQSFDSIRRTEMLTTFLDIISVFVGDGIYCIKDETAAAKTTAFESDGLIGMLESGSTSLLANLPYVGVADHLAQEFVPGYKENNSVMAIDDGTSTAPETCFGPSGGMCPCEKSVCSECTTDEGEVCTNEEPESGKCVFRGTDKTCACNSDPRCISAEEAKGAETAGGVGEKIREWILDAMSKYLGLGGIDYRKMKEDAAQAVEDKSGFEYLHESIQLSALWSITRNIAYLFFVIAMIIIGFMIMFRNKIGGQVMVTVSNSIPRIIVCLILVTFSFAISGIMLDLGKMAMNIVSKTMAKAQYEVTGEPVASVDIAGVGNLMDRAVYELEEGDRISLDIAEDSKTEEELNEILKKAHYDEIENDDSWVGKAKSTAVKILLRANLSLLTHALKGARISVPFLDIVKNIVITGLVEIPNFSRLLKSVLFLLIAAFASFKLFITILTSYAKIFVNVVLGPIQIAMGAIPGNFNSVTRWFKTILSNVLVFPTIVAILEFAKFFALAIRPEKFVFFGQSGVFLPDGFISIGGVFFIAGYFFAANAPNLIKGIIKVEEDKTMTAAGASVKESMSKLPLIGGMFGK